MPFVKAYCWKVRPRYSTVSANVSSRGTVPSLGWFSESICLAARVSPYSGSILPSKRNGTVYWLLKMTEYVTDTQSTCTSPNGTRLDRYCPVQRDFHYYSVLTSHVVLRARPGPGPLIQPPPWLGCERLLSHIWAPGALACVTYGLDLQVKARFPEHVETRDNRMSRIGW